MPPGIIWVDIKFEIRYGFLRSGFLMAELLACISGLMVFQA